MKPGYKQTEIGVIPEDWEIKCLPSFGDVVSGGTPSTSVSEYWDGDIAWCTPSDITRTKGTTIAKTERYITVKGLANSAAALLPPGCVLLCTRATIGDSKINSVAMATNQGFKNIIPKNCNITFLFYLLQTKKQEMLEKAIGSTFLEISKNALCSIPLQYPPVPEQQRIAEALSDMDELIASLEKLIAKKKAIKQGAMQELLTGKRRLPGFTGEWEAYTVKDISNFCTSTVPVLGISVQNYIGTDNMNSNIGGVRDNEIAITYTNVREYQVGDILLSNIRPYLKKIWIADRNGGCSNDVLVIRVTDRCIVLPSFLYYLLSQDGFFEEVMANAVGTKMPRGDKNVIKEYCVRLPREISEQSAIVEALHDMDNSIELFSQKLKKARHIKQGMMQQLLTGKIRSV